MKGDWTWTVLNRGDGKTTADSDAAQASFKVIGVQFDTQEEGKSPKEVLYIAGSAVEKPEDPTREGYLFDGWFTDESCTEAFDFETTKPENDATLYAKWIVARVETPAGLGVAGERAEDGCLNGKFTWNAPSADTEHKRAGYTHVLTSPDKKETAVSSTAAETSFDHALTQKGTWSWKMTALGDDDAATRDSDAAEKTFSVIGIKFDTQVNGETPQEVLYMSGSSIEKPNDPERDDWTFDGWFTDTEGKNAFEFETAKPESDTVIYAHWTRIITKLGMPENLEMSTARSEDGVLSGTFSWDAVEADEGKVSGYRVTLTDPDGIDWTQGGMTGTETEFATALTKEGDWTITVTAVGGEENGSSDSKPAELTVSVISVTFDPQTEFDEPEKFSIFPLLRSLSLKIQSVRATHLKAGLQRKAARTNSASTRLNLRRA